MLIRIKNYNMSDIIASVKFLLDRAAHSQEVRQQAIQITYDKQDNISSIYDWVKSCVSYISDPIGTGNDEIELFISPIKMVKDFQSGLRLSGDCVTGDTPIWIKKSGVLELVEIRELLPVGEYTQFLGTDILTPSGFQPLISIRKKGTSKPVIRLIGTSDIGLTVDHKVVSNINSHNGDRYTKAEDIRNIAQVVKCYPELGSNGKGNYDLGWGYGLFFADGSCSLRKNRKKFYSSGWCINNINTDYLERAKAIFENEFPFLSFDIRIQPSNTVSTNYGPRTKPLATLCTKLRKDEHNGTRTRFDVAQRTSFYNSFGVKKVPNFVLHGNSELVRGFWDGVEAGDGSLYDLSVTSATKLSTMGLSMVLSKLGKQLLLNPDRGRRFTGVYIHPRTGPSREHDKFYDIIKQCPSSESVVYDICTQSGEFVVGDIAIKNCDDHAILCVSLFRALGIRSNVVIVDSIGNGFDHAYSRVWSNKLNMWINCDTTSDYPLGWEYSHKGTIIIG